MFFVYLHEIGHWLGAKGDENGHANDGEKSVMVRSPLQAFLGSSSMSKRVWSRDALAVCSNNVCPDAWCRKEKESE